MDAGRSEHEEELSDRPEVGIWGVARRLQSAASNGFIHRWAAGRIPAGAVVVDLACGDGRLGRVLGADVTWIGLDFVERLARRAVRYTGGRPAAVADVTMAPVRSASADVVTCFEVLEHLPDPAAAVAEMARIVRPGGVLLLSVPNDAGLKHRLKRDPHPLHVQEMDLDAVRSLVGAHFGAVEVHLRGFWFFTPGRVSLQVGWPMPVSIATNILVEARASGRPAMAVG